MPLSFATLRKANTLRLPQFKNSRGGPAHSEPDGSDWSKGEWMNAILGELGEAANLIKKVKRGDLPLHAAMELLAYEFADVVTYTDLTALQFKISFDYFVDFETFSNMNDSILQSNSQLTLGEWMNRAFGYFGAAAAIVDSMPFSRNSGGSPYIGPIRNYFINGLVAINCAARSIDLNLGNCVLRKFNHVSSRVKADVFIDAEGTAVVNLNGDFL